MGGVVKHQNRHHTLLRGFTKSSEKKRIYKIGHSCSGSDDHLCGHLWHASDRTSVDHGILNLALVVAAVDLEEAIVTPVLIPAVCNKPIWSSILCAISHDLDGMAT